MGDECVSIIIPAYNVENYIEKGLLSCINQSYRNIEIVVVDDGSDDNTWEVIQRYALIDLRIKAIRQSNKGVSTARNTALDNSMGEYVLFLDSDDWLEYDAVENLLRWQNQHVNKLISGGMYFAYSEKNGIINKVLQHVNQCEEVLVPEAALFRFEGNLGLISSCYKLYRKNIISANSLYFDTDIFHGEDGLFVFKYLHYTDGLYFNPTPLWVIYDRPNSATTGGYNSKWLTAITAVNRMIEFEQNSEIKTYLELYRINRAMTVMRKALLSKEAAITDVKSLQNTIRAAWKIYLSGESTNKRKVYYIGMAFFPIKCLKILFNKIL